MSEHTPQGVDEVVSTGVVVVGTGAAGLSVALGLAELFRARGGVTLVTKAALGEGGSSAWAQGGIAAALGDDDSPERHAADTLAVGAGLSDPEIVALLTREGVERVRSLPALGAMLDRGAERALELGREAGHSRNRIVHARGDQTGAELVRALRAALLRHEGVTIAEHTFALDLLVDEGRAVGLLVRAADGRCVLYRSGAVVLATGGIGQLYARTTNPPEVTGDGLAIAARAGARLVDLEFVQFHPTALATRSDPMPLLTEALRGEGATIIDGHGQRFLVGLHPAAELAPRDGVARAIWEITAAGGEAFLDARAAPGERFPLRFPGVFALCQREGLDPRRQPIPISPAAHYHIGGIAVDACGHSSLPGLWAVGETACTGAHGANRLASNSLLEAMVFAARVARDIAGAVSGLASCARVERLVAALPGSRSSGRRRLLRADDDSGAVIAGELRQLMWERVGLVRGRRGLEIALRQIEVLGRRLGSAEGELRNMLDVAHLVALAALARQESRGVHYRADYPFTDARASCRQTLVGGAIEVPWTDDGRRTPMESPNRVAHG